VSFETTAAWMTRPPTRKERILALSVTAFAGFWIGAMAAAFIEPPRPSSAIVACMLIGAVAGCTIAWFFPKQALCILGARALFRIPR